MAGQRHPDAATELWRQSNRLGKESWQVRSPWVPSRRLQDDDSARTDGEGAVRRGWGPRQQAASTPVSLDAGRQESRSKAGENGALTSVIEGEVIPRLLEAHRRAHALMGQPAADAARERLLGEREVAACTQALVGGGSMAALSLVNDLRREGVGDDAILAHLLDPVARRLDERWNGLGDSFTDVSLAVERLHRLLHDMERGALDDIALRGLDRRVLVAAAPGEEPSCSALLVSALFQRAGWDVIEVPPVESYEDLMRVVREEWVAVTYLCVTRPCRVPGLGRGIESLRRASDNPDLKILLGGVVVRGEPAIATRAGADVAVPTGPEAVERAEGLLGTATGTC